MGVLAANMRAAEDVREGKTNCKMLACVQFKLASFHLTLALTCKTNGFYLEK